MALFKNAIESHAHSLKVLTMLREYDTFVESLQSILDVGCGAGHDARWWSELTTRDDIPEPLNYTVYAMDRDISKLDAEIAEIENIVPIEGDFETKLLSRKVDLIWAHDVFQYARDPWGTLATWKNNMHPNGMLVLSIPQNTYFDYTRNKLIVSNHSYQYYNYNLLTLTYMLACSGFDCRDAYFLREKNSPWLYAAVYATDMEPAKEALSWFDLADRQLINDSIIKSITAYGYARLQDVVVSWLDKNNYFAED